MMRRLVCNKFARWGCLLLCYLMLAFFYIVTVWKEIPLFILIGMAVFLGIRKKWFAMAFSICLLLLGWVCTFEWTRTRANLEMLHFALLKPYYQSAAEKVLEETAQAADTNIWKSVDGGSDLFLAKEIHYAKIDEHVVIFFFTKYSDCSGCVYLSDDEAFRMMEEPRRYWTSARDPIFSQVYELGGGWLFARRY